MVLTFLVLVSFSVVLLHLNAAYFNTVCANNVKNENAPLIKKRFSALVDLQWSKQ